MDRGENNGLRFSGKVLGNQAIFLPELKQHFLTDRFILWRQPVAIELLLQHNFEIFQISLNCAILAAGVYLPPAYVMMP